jgi:hypothetical protein
LGVQVLPGVLKRVEVGGGEMREEFRELQAIIEVQGRIKR